MIFVPLLWIYNPDCGIPDRLTCCCFTDCNIYVMSLVSYFSLIMWSKAFNKQSSTEIGTQHPTKEALFLHE